ncbi:MAG: winged helix-turn-helix transcriptional regulator [Thermonemataceae bacterium]
MAEKIKGKSEKKLPTINPCPVTETVKVIGGKWKASILWDLFQYEKLRFGELSKLIPGVTSKMLTQQLRELEVDGVIKRSIYAVMPPKVEYSLTERGESLYPILYEMSRWGLENSSKFDDYATTSDEEAI